MSTLTPLFWYCGSKKWGIASDIHFIRERLQWLSYENQKIACDEYDEIYKRHINSGEVRLARLNANTMLNELVKKYGITKKDYREIQAANDDEEYIAARIEELKAAQKRAKPHISFERRSRKCA